MYKKQLINSGAQAVLVKPHEHRLVEKNAKSAAAKKTRVKHCFIRNLYSGSKTATGVLQYTTTTMQPTNKNYIIYFLSNEIGSSFQPKLAKKTAGSWQKGA